MYTIAPGILTFDKMLSMPANLLLLGNLFMIDIDYADAGYESSNGICAAKFI